MRGALGQVPESVTRLQGGANNVVARVVADGRPFVAKIYFVHPDDPRDRMGTEFATLSFLWRNGVRCIPEPLVLDRAHGLAIYEFVDGARLAPSEVGWDDVLQLSDLLAGMWALRLEPEAKTLPPASEAFFTLSAYLCGLEARLERLRVALAGAPAVHEARAFVEHRVVPRTRLLRQFVEESCASLGLDLERELPLSERTLSPADFGFHNVLRRDDGRLVFLDFEYAGWDDPATMLSQACLAPAVPLPPAHRAPLLRGLRERLDATGELLARLRFVYPLVALKWSMIVLNDFVPMDSERRAFAGASELARGADQIDKSELLLNVVDESVNTAGFLDELLNR